MQKNVIIQEQLWQYYSTFQSFSRHLREKKMKNHYEKFLIEVLEF